MPGVKLSPRDGFLLLVLALVTLGIYWPLARADFINYDDNDYITENAVVQTGVNGTSIAWAFTTGTSGNWHPLTWLSHELDCQLYGLNAGKHHLTNLLFHVANSLLLFLLLRITTGSYWRSGAVAALFAWHPLHVESVAWVAERKDVLSCFFFILTLLAYTAYVRRGGFARYALSLGLFALGLMAKPMLVSVPFVLLLLDFWPMKRVVFADQGANSVVRWQLWGRLFREKLPFFILSGISCVVTYGMQDAGGAFGTRHFSFETRIANALISYVRYLDKLLWPANLSAFYPFDEGFSGWKVAGAALLILAATFAAVRFARGRPYYVVGWLWYLGTLVPVIGLVKVGLQSMADRYMYIPSVGIFIAATWGMHELATARSVDKSFLLAAGVIPLAACLAITSMQVRYWQNSVSLFSHSLEVTANNQVAEYCLGQALSANGRIDEALPHYLEAVRLNPNDNRAHNNLGLCLALRGRLTEATNHYVIALRLNPNNSEARLNFALALSALGDQASAISQLSDYLRSEPGDAEAHYTLGSLLVLQGRDQDARTELTATLRLKPNFAAAHAKLGSTLIRLGDAASAVEHFREALRLNADDAEVLNNLAWVRAASANPALRDGAEAVRLARRACELTANTQPVLLGTLAAAYAEAGQFPEAQATARQAAKLARAANQPEVAARNEQLLTLFLANQPYHESPPQ